MHHWSEQLFHKEVAGLAQIYKSSTCSQSSGMSPCVAATFLSQLVQAYRNSSLGITGKNFHENHFDLYQSKVIITRKMGNFLAGIFPSGISRVLGEGWNIEWTSRENFQKSPAQITLRWGLHMDHSIIPKGVNESRIKENLNLFWLIPPELFSKIFGNPPDHMLPLWTRAFMFNSCPIYKRPGICLLST